MFGIATHKTYAVAATLLMLLVASGQSLAQSVEAKLSSREAYIGQTIILTITVSNTKKYDTPKIPEVDGLFIGQAGAPSRNSSIQIFNGRQTSSSSLTWSFGVTPRREGEFTIPPFDVLVDGGPRRTPAFRIVVTKSETGDLLFVEVEADAVANQVAGPNNGQAGPSEGPSEGGKRGYVGQPIRLRLKTWIRPYSDKELEVKLSSTNMWQMVSENSTWGVFQERLDQMAQQREQPRGEDVLRQDRNGDSRAYYLYEIESMVYPKRPGQIDVGDVQVIVNYPTALSVSRRRSRSLFDSPFNRPSLAIESYRPISAEATLPPIEVVDVPMDGRPDDYRGAVGSYQIGAQAEPKKVNAGDPITLQLVLQGDGPMELVQAPPFSTLPELTRDFKVADDQLAGFVKDDAKLFTTTIRPHREGITSIPSIPFSFFNPETEEFETVHTKPVPISVAASETLSLDEIVGGSAAPGRPTETSDLFKKRPQRPAVVLQNIATYDVLRETRSVETFSWMTLFGLLAAPITVGVCWLVKERDALARRFLPNQTPYQKFVSKIRSADSLAELSQVLRTETVDLPSALSEIVERCERTAYAPASERDLQTLEQMKASAIESLPDSDDSTWLSGQHAVATMLVLILASVVADVACADGPSSLSVEQQKILIDEANSLYASADGQEVAEKNELLEQAMSKYQLVAESGLCSSALYFNLGNSAVQLGDFVQAIAYYEQAQRFAMDDANVARNLRFARSKLNADSSDVGNDVEASDSRDDATVTIASNFLSTLTEANSRWSHWATSVAVVTWISIWILIGGSLFRIRIPYWKAIVATLSLLFVIAAVSLVVTNRYVTSFNGLAIAEKTELRQADGDAFPIVGELTQCQRVKLLESRGRWVRVRATDSSSEGWAKTESVFQIRG